MPMNAITPVLLLILDGFGHREEGEDNAILRQHPQLGRAAPATLQRAGRLEHAVGLARQAVWQFWKSAT